jgi:amidohydrolase
MYVRADKLLIEDLTVAFLMVDINYYKNLVCNEVDSNGGRLIEISDWLYKNPEYGCEEFEASKLLSSELEKNKFKVEKPFLGMTTSFKATYRGKPGGPRIAILGEYDALEGIGHGCGHNIIGTAAIGAGIAISKIIKNFNGEVIVLGCPAEENRKGGPPGGWPCQFSKAIMCAQGVFDDIDVAMMVHPSSGLNIMNKPTLIGQYIDIVFKGKTAHASGNPWEGRNAMQAAVLFINGVNAMRQQFRRGKPYSPVTHWIITEAGTAGNVIPDIARLYGGIRSQDKAYLQELFEMVKNCAKGAALMTGTDEEITLRPGGGLDTRVDREGMAAMSSNLYLTELMFNNFQTLGVELEDWRVTARSEPGGGTDFSNVTRRVPGLHPHISVSKKTIAGHSIELAKATTSDEGHKALLDGAKAMAMTAVDILVNPEHINRMKAVHLIDIDEYLSSDQRFQNT